MSIIRITWVYLRVPKLKIKLMKSKALFNYIVDQVNWVYESYPNSRSQGRRKTVILRKCAIFLRLGLNKDKN